MIKKIAVIVAAGNGTRMGSAIPKQFLLLHDKPILWHSIAVFQKAFSDIEVILVAGPDQLLLAEAIRKNSLFPNQILVVSGGNTRFESVKIGLSMIKEEGIVFVHDGVRCLATKKLLENCFRIAMEKGSAVPVIPIRDSICLNIDGEYRPVDRNDVRIIQTPQVFFSDSLKRVFEQPYDKSFTDESAVAQKGGILVHMIEGEETNIKITHPIDLLIAETILRERVY